MNRPSRIWLVSLAACLSSGCGASQTTDVDLTPARPAAETTLSVHNQEQQTGYRRQAKIEYAIALHGGAGRPPEGLTVEERAAYEESLAVALRIGVDVLKGGGTSLDAVERVVRSLEDDPKFNAGKGAVFNLDGGHELHASIMDGKTLNCGAVAAVDSIRNPVSVARLVMTDTPFILMVGEGAERLAADKGVEPVPSSYFDTDFRRKRWEKAREQASLGVDQSDDLIGTVGCVALDSDGNLAAATSTGGVAHKRFGRMGDSSIIGAGNYADNRSCAVSCTGIGEHFIRHVVAHNVSTLMRYKGSSIDEAVNTVVTDVLPPESGGLIAIDKDGTIVMQSNRGGMRRAAADSSGRFEVRFWE